MSGLAEKLSESLITEAGMVRNAGRHSAPLMAHFAASKLASLVEGGWVRHGENCAVMGIGSFSKRVGVSQPGMASAWRMGDELTCTCGLARALGFQPKGARP